MRTLLLLGWLIVPIAGVAYHYGPGQEKMRLDDVARTLVQADQQALAGDWQDSAKTYDAALALIPADRAAETRRVRLERDKAWMNAAKLPEASVDLKSLVDELQADPKANARTLASAREAFANSQYYTTWLMKLEGMPRDDWEPEIESARQTFRLLAQEAKLNGDSSAVERNEEDLESVIRLARMDPNDLQGMALPKQCQNCKSGQCKKPGRNPSKKTSKAATKDSRSAGAGPPPDGSGS